MRNVLEPAYQPIQDLELGRHALYEALARICGDEDSAGHGKLIKLAEDFGFVHHIDHAMLQHILDDARHHDHAVAINVSVRTIEGAANDLLNTMDQHRETAGRLIFEITETVKPREYFILHRFADLARSHGARLALDDYGAGAGHITDELVRSLRPDFLKLDGSLLEQAVTHGEHGHLRRATDLALSVGTQCIAEYVDTTRKIDLLKAIGVRFAQGACFGMPTRQRLSAGHPPHCVSSK